MKKIYIATSIGKLINVKLNEVFFHLLRFGAQIYKDLNKLKFCNKKRVELLAMVRERLNTSRQI